MHDLILKPVEPAPKCMSLLADVAIISIKDEL
jgi:hypothetical protein